MAPRLTLLRLKLLGGAATLSLLDPLSAVAAGPLPSWTGFYVGGHVGYGWGQLTGDTTHNVVAPPGFFGANTQAFSIDRDLQPNGILGGIHAGYNFQSAGFVYGVEADVTWTGQEDSVGFSGKIRNFQNSLEDFAFEETLQAKLRYMGTVRGRFGHAFGQFLPYITGGLAWGRLGMDLQWTAREFNLDSTSLNKTPVSFSGSQTETLVGWTLGAGFEYAFAPQWSVRTEYLYVDLGERTFFAGVQGGGEFGFQNHILRFAVSFKIP